MGTVMTMGDKIKECREQKELSQEQLGAMLKPQVNKAAINKWEKGTVENIKRTHIQQMAKIFGISPCELMAWSDEDSDQTPTQNVMTPVFTSEQNELLKLFTELNTEGQEELLNYAAYIASQSKYQNKKKELLNA